MTYRTYRLSISPSDVERARQILDVDGRTSLHELHLTLLDTLQIGDRGEPYAFFMSGQHGDPETEYVDPRVEGRRADKALLFRLRLESNKAFLYVPDIHSNGSYSLRLVSVSEASAPLRRPVLVETVGDLSEIRRASRVRPLTPSELSEMLPLARGVIEPPQDLQWAPGELPPEPRDRTRPMLRHASEAAVALARHLHAAGDPVLRLRQLDGHSDGDFVIDSDRLLTHLLELPLDLSAAGEIEHAVRVAEAFAFLAPDALSGDVALIHAQAGNRALALAQLEKNLATAVLRTVAEAKAGDVYRALGEDDAAEAYYRRSLAEAGTSGDVAEARLRLVSFLVEQGREQDAAKLLGENAIAPKSVGSPQPGPGAEGSLPASRTKAPGRNDPCFCGSGKKYKKCHG